MRLGAFSVFSENSRQKTAKIPTSAKMIPCICFIQDVPFFVLSL